MDPASSATTFPSRKSQPGDELQRQPPPPSPLLSLTGPGPSCSSGFWVDGGQGKCRGWGAATGDSPATQICCVPGSVLESELFLALFFSLLYALGNKRNFLPYTHLTPSGTRLFLSEISSLPVGFKGVQTQVLGVLILSGPPRDLPKQNLFLNNPRAFL